MKILLVEPDFPIPPKSKNHKNFLPIGLLKIGRYLKAIKHPLKIKLIRGNKRAGFYPDEIYITSLFTYWSEHFWKSVEFYRKSYPKSKIKVGGIYVSLYYNDTKFRKTCRKLAVTPFFGVHYKAEKYLPDYGLLNNKQTPLNYQIVHSTRSCPRKCKFCFTWKIEPKLKSKDSLSNEICSNKLVFYDNNLLMNEHIEKLLDELSISRWNNKQVYSESQSGFDGRVLELKPELAILLKKARFINPRIAWDWKYNQWKKIENQIKILRSAGYSAKEISIFMIFNWDIPFKEMEKKRLKCWEWKVQITDCRNRPIKQLSDHFNSRIPQNNNDYFIHPKWTDKQVKQFRRNVRRQNICVRHGFNFHSPILERKGVSKKLSMTFRKLKRASLKKRFPKVWFPDE
jgi:hypothetical protein